MVASVIPRAFFFFLNKTTRFYTRLHSKKTSKRTLCPRAQEGLVSKADANDQEALLSALSDEIEN